MLLPKRLDLISEARRPLILLAVRSFVEKRRIKNDHYHAAVLRQPSQHVVRNVPCVIVDAAHSRMRRDQRSLRDVEHVIHYFRRDVRNVDQDPQAVHLAHHFFAKLRQPVALDLAAVCVGPVV